ncbi:hypothetical protein PybrP1_008290 [[Pythium] brassicae (nom. inval.)]|nr:hypothetical protein PybrP1_008290 [[Pythium] brassicae (nom. inval.)]
MRRCTDPSQEAHPLASPLMPAPSASQLEDDDDELDPSWTMPHYDLDRAAEIARKLAHEELALVAPAAVLQLGGTVSAPFEYEIDHKAVRFAGLYVVNGPTEPRHIRYAMELSVPELQLRTRCIQRFRSFYVLRQRLLRATKRCCHEQLQRQLEANSNQSLKLSALESWRELPLTLRPPRCHACRCAHKALKAVVFPRRRVFATTAEDVRVRSLQLEAFLGACARLMVEWPGCVRGRRLVAAVLGKFLGVDILQQLFPSRYGYGGRDEDCAPPPMSGGTAGLSSRSASSYSAAVASELYGGALSSRTLLSGRSSSSSSLSLHDV